MNWVNISPEKFSGALLRGGKNFDCVNFGSLNSDSKSVKKVSFLPSTVKMDFWFAIENRLPEIVIRICVGILLISENLLQSVDKEDSTSGQYIWFLANECRFAKEIIVSVILKLSDYQLKINKILVHERKDWILSFNWGGNCLIKGEMSAIVDKSNIYFNNFFGKIAFL